LTADSRTLEMLAEQLTVLPLLRTDAPILADNPFVAGMLRLAQFKLSAAGGKGDEAGQIATVLFAEISGTPDDELKSSFESMALMSVLCTMGVASYLWDWMALLRRLKHLVVSDDFMSDLRQRIEGKGDDSDPSFFGSLFGIGVAGLASVAKLEHIVDELDKFDSRERLSWLTTIDKAFSDYSVFINGPWAAEQRSEGFDAAEAALRYHRMAHKTIGWNIRHIPVQCYVARTVMLDEYQDDQQGALAVLDEAVAALGEDPVLSRARAKVYWRRDQYSNALAILRSIADQIGANNPIERAYALREAAISAAKSDEWPQAEQWFLEAQTAAMRASADDMNVMAIGLGADASAAALQADETVRGLKTLAEALHSLMEVDPEASLRAAYCHRVVRHTVLWAKNHVGNLHVEIDGEPIGMLPGSCSNPDPSPTIRDHPLGPIDIAWYMLADTEISAGLDIGISTTLHERLVDGQIPILELRRKIHADVERLDAMRFSDDLASYAESIVYLSENAAELRTGFDPLAPLRGCIPVLSTTAPF
jgi:hypothetical protein